MSARKQQTTTPFDRERLQEIMDAVNAATDTIAERTGLDTVRKLRGLLLGPAFDTVEKVFTQRRQPTLAVVGRTGHGKSSLINALAGRDAVKVGEGPKAQTAKTQAVPIVFEHPDRDSRFTWRVLDTRGVFDALPPEGVERHDAVDQLVDDLRHNKPDVILHVIAVEAVREMAPDMVIMDRLRREYDPSVPVIGVLSKADKLDPWTAWPPEDDPGKAGTIHNYLRVFAEDILRAPQRPLHLGEPWLGVKVEHESYRALIPIANRAEEHRTWNLDTLRDYLGSVLPDEVLLEYYGAFGEREMRKLADHLVHRFTRISVGIGVIPIADIALLLPYQMLLVAMIAALSGRGFSRDAVFEFFGAMGVNVGTGLGVRQIEKWLLRETGKMGARRTLLKFVPFAGTALSMAMAASSTWALGKAAQAYFFDDEIRDMGAFKGLWRKVRGRFLKRQS